MHVLLRVLNIEVKYRTYTKLAKSRSLPLSGSVLFLNQKYTVERESLADYIKLYCG